MKHNPTKYTLPKTYRIVNENVRRPLYLASTISLIITEQSGPVAPNTNPKNNLNTNIQPIVYEQLVANTIKTDKPLNIIRETLLPMTSAIQAHRKFPVTTPNKNEEPNEATSF